MILNRDLKKRNLSTQEFEKLSVLDKIYFRQKYNDIDKNTDYSSKIIGFLFTILAMFSMVIVIMIGFSPIIGMEVYINFLNNISALSGPIIFMIIIISLLDIFALFYCMRERERLINNLFKEYFDTPKSKLKKKERR